MYIQRSLTLLGRRGAFWDTKPEMLFISLLQLNDEVNLSLEALETHIEDACSQAKGKTALYRCADFCDMVLFVRDLPYTAYQTLVWKLVFDKRLGIRDTVTLLCFERASLLSRLSGAILRRYEAVHGDSGQPYYITDLSTFLVEENAVLALLRNPAEKERLRKDLAKEMSALEDEDGLTLMARMQDGLLHSNYLCPLLENRDTREAALNTLAGGIVHKLSIKLFNWYHAKDKSTARSFLNLTQAILQAHSEGLPYV